MGAIYFYHLTRTPLEVTLPKLLTRARGAGWTIAIRANDEKFVDWLDQKLWQGDGFLPHGRSGGEFDADQPILLTTQAEAANGAQCVMAVNGAEIAPQELDALERGCLLFDGNDAQAVENARAQWRRYAETGCEAQYWSQESGAWEKKAESGGSG